MKHMIAMFDTNVKLIIFFVCVNNNIDTNGLNVIGVTTNAPIDLR